MTTTTITTENCVLCPYKTIVGYVRVQFLIIKFAYQTFYVPILNVL